MKDPYQKRVEEEFDEGIGRRIMQLEESYCTEMGFDCDFADYHETKSFIISHHLQFLRDEIVRLEGMKENWTPTQGYSSEEELGFQKGIKAQIGLQNKKIDDLISHYREMLEANT